MRLAKGYRGRAKNCWKLAARKVEKGLQFAYKSRRLKKRDARTNWIMQAGAASREHNMTYSMMIYGSNLANIGVNRKILAQLANQEPYSFRAIIEEAKLGLKEAVLSGQKKPNSAILKAAGMPEWDAERVIGVKPSGPVEGHSKRVQLWVDEAIALKQEKFAAKKNKTSAGPIATGPARTPFELELSPQLGKRKPRPRDGPGWDEPPRRHRGDLRHRGVRGIATRAGALHDAPAVAQGFGEASVSRVVRWLSSWWS